MKFYMVLGMGWSSSGCWGGRDWESVLGLLWAAITFVVYNGEVWMNSKFWHQLKEKFVSLGRLIFVNCTHGLYQL